MQMSFSYITLFFINVVRVQRQSLCHREKDRKRSMNIGKERERRMSREKERERDEKRKDGILLLNLN